PVITRMLNKPSPPPAATANLDRLARPVLPPNPAQADYGAQIYYESCMACHGDRGQGLTDEWRAAWSQDDQNCWQSKCHATNHPPEGFKLPRYVPPIIGNKTLARFQTAADLHAFLVAKMPWQAPGLFDEATYWQLTAFLLRANGVNLGNTPLGPENAGKINW
ncbi:MAG TPA: c-type cytochrome, partial [Anaerolineae bacterium]|nr:c-type cytochrome [Anaerolineae bacterium]